jgi:DNA-binding NarL/FixJ family response regulator
MIRSLSLPNTLTAAAAAVEESPLTIAPSQPVVATTLIADDHEVVRTGLRSMLEKLGGTEVVAEASDGRTAVRLARELTPDLIIVDIMLPLLNGIETTRHIVADNPDARVIVCSSDHKQVFVEESIKAGARGYLLKSSASVELAVAVRAVLRREVYLSPKAAEMIVDKYIRNTPAGSASMSNLSQREREVLQLVAGGMSNKQIGVELNLSVRTVEAHRTQLMEKLHIRSVAELTKYAIREGITTLDV